MKNNQRPTEAQAVTGHGHWMDRYGIKFNERLTVSKAQLQAKMRPCFPLKTRIWAYLLLHTAGYQGEHAQTMKAGTKTAVQPPDIAADLQKSAAKYYRDAGVLITKEEHTALRPRPHEMRTAIAAMEQDGICERRHRNKPLREMSIKQRQAKLNGEIDLYVWLRPRKPPDENVRQEFADRCITAPPPENTNSNIRRHLKTEYATLSRFIRHFPEDQQKYIAEAWDSFVQVVNRYIPEATEIAAPAPPEIAEDSVGSDDKIRTGKEELLRQKLALAGLALEEQDHKTLCDILVDTPTDIFFQHLESRLSRGRIGFPVLLKIAAKSRQAFEHNRAALEAAQRAEREQELQHMRRLHTQAHNVLADGRSTPDERRWAEELLQQSAVA